MDYSLLIGIHKLTEEELAEEKKFKKKKEEEKKKEQEAAEMSPLQRKKSKREEKAPTSFPSFLSFFPLFWISYPLPSISLS